MGIDLDKVLNYEALYAAEIKKAKISGGKLTGLCPFHNDTSPSFSVDLKKGQYKCFSCNAHGNYINFVAEKYGIDTKEAYALILKENGLSEDKPEEEQKKPLPVYTLAMYAAEKHLPLEFLQSLGLSEGKNKIDGGFVVIPYKDEQGTERNYRRRFGVKKGQKGKRFDWKAGAKNNLILYGLEAWADIKEKGYVILIEGESDTQTLRFLGFPALGVPGASTFKAEWAEKLQGLNVYIHVEPDSGGEAFLTNITRALAESEHKGKVYKWRASDYGGEKDPSELLINAGEEKAKEYIDSALKNAEAAAITKETKDLIEGEPVHLRQPQGWLIRDKGIFRLDTKTLDYYEVCRTPILLVRRLCGIETGEEKMEIAFKRDNRWTKAILPRSAIFQSKNIVGLTDLGCMITSENARHIVNFLADMERENGDLLELAESTSILGWQGKEHFLPYAGGGIVLDVDKTLAYLANAYTTSGTLKEWAEMIAPLRDNYIFRFILAASFAAPLLKIVNQRVFIIHNWANSKGGKTAALKCALSVWGDPNCLMTNFNATQTALERTASFYCDLPLGIDERQLAGNDQEGLEKIVYMLASGSGRARGNRNGGLQSVKQWRTIALATGEEPLTTDTSQTGISTRVLELYGAPFDDEQQASIMHQKTAAIYGTAGAEYIKHLIALGENAVNEKYNEFFEVVQALSNNTNGAHIACIALVAVADYIISKHIFGTSEADSYTAALEMAEKVVNANAENAARDVNKNALGYLYDWTVGHASEFGDFPKVERVGRLDKDYIYFFPSAFDKILKSGGYNPKKTIRYLDEKGLLVKAKQGTKTITARIAERVCRVYRIELLKIWNVLGISEEERESFLVEVNEPPPKEFL